MDPHAARLSHKSVVEVDGAFSTSRVSGKTSLASVSESLYSTNAGEYLRLTHAARPQQIANTPYRVDQRIDCRRDERRGSIRNGKLNSASREARFDSAKRW